jgi:RNA polymerase sigma-70 factor (ECF subfamily)
MVAEVVLTCRRKPRERRSPASSQRRIRGVSWGLIITYSHRAERDCDARAVRGCPARQIHKLNDLARRLDTQPAPAELSEGLVPAPASSVSGLTPEGLRMLQAIDQLPEDEREVFDLVRIQGMTQEEAAQLLGVSAVTVKRWLNRSLRLLTEQLADLRPYEQPPDSI